MSDEITPAALAARVAERDALKADVEAIMQTANEHLNRAEAAEARLAAILTDTGEITDEMVEAVARKICDVWGYEWDAPEDDPQHAPEDNFDYDERPSKRLYREAARAVAPLIRAPLAARVAELEREKAATLGLVEGHAATIRTLEEEGFALAAGQCIIDGGLVGDEWGSAICTLNVRVSKLESALESIAAISLLDKDPLTKVVEMREVALAQSDAADIARRARAEASDMEKPLTAEALADALGCFWNAALGAQHAEMTTVSCIAEGIQAVSTRLTEIARRARAEALDDAIRALRARYDLLHADALARQRGVYLDGSPRRETVPVPADPMAQPFTSVTLGGGTGSTTADPVRQGLVAALNEIDALARPIADRAQDADELRRRIYHIRQAASSALALARIEEGR